MKPHSGFDLKATNSITKKRQQQISDLLRKTQLKPGIDKTGDKVEAERKAFATVTVGFFEDAPDFE